MKRSKKVLHSLAKRVLQRGHDVTRRILKAMETRQMIERKESDKQSFALATSVTRDLEHIFGGISLLSLRMINTYPMCVES